MGEYPNSQGYPSLGYLQLNEYPTHAHESIQGTLNEVIAENLLTNCEGKTLEVPFSVNWDQINLFNKLTGYTLKSQKDNQGNVFPHNTHWMLAVLHAVAERGIGHLRDKEGTIEIGPTPGFKGHPDCLLDGRDEARYVQKHRFVGEEELLRILRGDHSTGAAECDLPATDALALFSTQDMEYRDVYNIFKVKGLQTMTCAMLLPIEYYNDQQSFTDTTANITWKHQAKKTKLHTWTDLTMCMPDKSFNYVHKKPIIEQWLKQGGYNGKEFNLTFEIQRNYGPLCIIKIVRVYRAGKLSRTIRSPDSRLVQVPDFAEALPIVNKLTNSFWESRVKPEDFYQVFKALKRYTITKRILEKTTQFLYNRDDKSVTRNHTGSYISGQAYQITVRNWCIQEGFNLAPEDHEGLATALLIRAMVIRWKSSKMISYLVKDIQQSDAGGVGAFFRKLGNTIFHPFAFPWTKKRWNKLLSKDKVKKKTLEMSDAHYYLYCLLKISGEEAQVEEYTLTEKQRAHLGAIAEDQIANF